jgi:hypothetical protein
MLLFIYSQAKTTNTKPLWVTIKQNINTIYFSMGASQIPPSGHHFCNVYGALLFYRLCCLYSAFAKQVFQGLTKFCVCFVFSWLYELSYNMYMFQCCFLCSFTEFEKLYNWDPNYWKSNPNFHKQLQQ